MSNNHDDFAASIGATPADDHEDFAASIGATPAGDAPPADPSTWDSIKGGISNLVHSYSLPKTLGEAGERLLKNGLLQDPNNGPKPQVDADGRIQNQQELSAYNHAGDMLGVPPAMMPAMVAAEGASVGVRALTGLGNGAIRTGVNSGVAGAGTGLDTLLQGGSAKDAGANALRAAKTSAVIGAAGELGAAGAGKASELMATKLLRRSPDVVRDYVADPTRFDQAPTFGEMVAKTKGVLTNAANEQQSAADAAADASMRARDARKQFVHDTGARRPAADTPQAVEQTLEKQRLAASKATLEQMALLKDRGDQIINLRPVDDVVNSALGERQIQGHTMPGDTDAAAIGKIKAMLDTLRPSPEASGGMASVTGVSSGPLPQSDVKVNPADAVKLRQQIDGMLQDFYSQNTGKHTERSAQAGLASRTKINELLDAMPAGFEGSAQRHELAQESNLANEGAQHFGNTDRLPSVLESLADPNNKTKLDLIKALDAKHKLGIMDRLQPYLDAQELVRNKPNLERAVSFLPESQAAASAQEALQAVKDRNAAFDGMTPKTTEQAIRSSLFSNEWRPQSETKAAFDAVGKAGGFDAARELQNLKIAGELGGGLKEGAQGSRMATIGRGIGKIGGHYGEAAGGVVGGALDLGAGWTAKKALDIAYSPLLPNAAQAVARDPAIIDYLRSKGLIK